MQNDKMFELAVVLAAQTVTKINGDRAFDEKWQANLAEAIKVCYKSVQMASKVI